MRSIADVKSRLEEMGIEPKKAFGQNFLINLLVINKIIAEVCDHKFSDLVEIGPGLGALTEPLLERGMSPHLIEIDKDLTEYWIKRGVQVTGVDALKLDWSKLNLRESSLLVSNLPYQISTSLVVDRCLGPRNLKWMVLMFQKEVAERLVAKPFTKDYGVLSVVSQLCFKIKKVADCAPGDFFPAPKVASRVLYFERLDSFEIEHRFLKFIKAGFQFRRKFLLKDLRSVVDKSDVGRLEDVFVQQGLSVKARAEELTPAQFWNLYKVIYEH